MISGSNRRLQGPRGSLTFAAMLHRAILLGSTVLVVAVLGPAACKKDDSGTTVATVRDPSYTGGAFTKLFVMGIARDGTTRRIHEDSMVAALRREGVAAQASYELFPQDDKLSEEEVVQAVEDGGFDGVVLTHVIWVGNQLEYVQGKTTTAPTSGVDLYMFGYDQQYETIQEPGYYESQTIYSVETVLHSVQMDGREVWSALSEAVDPTSLETLIESVTTSVIQGMKKDGMSP